jgi:hypothetical protein
MDPGFLGLEPVESALEFGLAIRVWIWVKDGIPRDHHNGSSDEGLVQVIAIDLAAGLSVSGEDLINGVVVLIEDLGVPDDGGKVPLNRTGEGVFPIGPEQAIRGLHEIAHVGIPVKRLMGGRVENVDRLSQVADEAIQSVFGEEIACRENGEAFGEDGEFWQRA